MIKFKNRIVAYWRVSLWTGP